MTQNSKKIITAAAELLNKHIWSATEAGLALTGDDHRGIIMTVVNELLHEIAEGGRLVAAVESNGDLLGFVPRMNVPIPEVATGPDNVSLPPSPDRK
jgi:hypothetical protein